MEKPKPNIPVNRMDVERFPKWEKNIQSYDVSCQWKEASARFTKEKLEIQGFAVMESWEMPYMQDLGHSGLRRFKQSWRPDAFLRKCALKCESYAPNSNSQLHARL